MTVIKTVTLCEDSLRLCLDLLHDELGRSGYAPYLERIEHAIDLLRLGLDE